MPGRSGPLGGRFQKRRGSAGNNLSIVGTPQAVLWTEILGATASANTLTKTAADGWGNSGAIARQTLEYGDDGYAELVISNEVDTFRSFGVSHSPTADRGYAAAGFPTIGFAVILNFGPPGYGQAGIYEGGQFKADDPNLFSPGDVFRISVNGGVVRYMHNGVVIYTSATAPVYPLIGEAGLYSQGSTATVWLSPAWVAHSMHEIEADLGNLGVWVNLTPDLLA